MGDGWDLHAVVRSCAALTRAPTTTVDQLDNPFLNLTSLDLGNHYRHDLGENQSYKWEGSPEEIYKESCVPPEPLMANPSPEEFKYLQPPEDSQNESVSFPASSTSRSRKRKNQPNKTVKQMTREELIGDLWAWRKYGQKPIKGSPYPRNYYRCSTSKGCGARKQVNRSPTDPTIFVVSYTGDHTHPQPTHRSSLASSSRTKFISDTPLIKKPISTPAVVSKPSCSSSSLASVSSFSPTTTLTKDESEIPDNDMILIPNLVMGEEIFRGFQELNNNGGGKVGLPNSLPPPGLRPIPPQPASPAAAAIAELSEKWQLSS